MNYLSDEQRRQAGWIGVQKCEVILKRALNVKDGLARISHRIRLVYARERISKCVTCKEKQNLHQQEMNRTK